MKTMPKTLASLLAGFALILTLFGCDTGLPSTPTPVPTSPPASPLAGVLDVTSFRMRDDWSGLAKFSSTNALYSFTKQSDGTFSGTADFSVDGQTGAPLTATETIIIPADVASKFLQKLSALPIQAGSYKPSITHTDDYPLLS